MVATVGMCLQVPFPGHPDDIPDSEYKKRFHSGIMGEGRFIKKGRIVKMVTGKDGKPEEDHQGYIGGWGSDPKVGRITGPAIAVAPDGSIWMSLLASYNTLVRIDPKDNNKRSLYGVLRALGGTRWRAMRGGRVGGGARRVERHAGVFRGTRVWAGGTRMHSWRAYARARVRSRQPPRQHKPS